MERGLPDEALVTGLRAVVGEQGLVCDDARLLRYNTPPWVGIRGGARLVLRPARTETRVALALMRGIKDHLDPLGIMNPGKVLGLREHQDTERFSLSGG